MLIIEEVEIEAPIERCFDLVRSVEVHEYTTEIIRGRAEGGRLEGLWQRGDRTLWSAVFFGCRFQLTMEASLVESPHFYNETLVKGLLRNFAHKYTLTTLESGLTVVRDELEVVSWLSLIVPPADKWLLYKRMQFIVRDRLVKIKLIAESSQWRDYLG
jgi:hypothetical protein